VLGVNPSTFAFWKDEGRTIMASTMSIHEYAGMRVIGGKKGTRRIGKVRHFIFHPTQRRCVGFLVHRPDFLLMFHRKDLFVALDGFTLDDGRILLPYKDGDQGSKGAIQRLGIDWDSCVMWEGLPIITKSGSECGTVGDVVCDRNTGAVKSIRANKGATSKALLGTLDIDVADIVGFKTGVGMELSPVGARITDDEEPIRGAILVANSVLEQAPEGGLAEKAGRGAAVAQDKATKVVAKAKPKVADVAHKTGKAVNKGAYVTGRQISRTKGMFSSFKEEYKKAVSDDNDPKEK
jgi:sporulation protein YlmC with PRC-barrel domain